MKVRERYDVNLKLQVNQNFDWKEKESSKKLQVIRKLSES